MVTYSLQSDCDINYVIYVKLHEVSILIIPILLINNTNFREIEWLVETPISCAPERAPKPRYSDV